MHTLHAIHIPRRIVVMGALVAVIATAAIFLLVSKRIGNPAPNCDALRAQSNSFAQNYVGSMQGNVSPAPLARATLDANAAQAGASCP